MERDFLGLSTTATATASPAVKHEINDAESAPVVQRGGMQWSFSDRHLSPSQGDSFQSHLQENPKRGSSYRVPSSRLLTVSTTNNSSQQVYRPQGVRLYAVPNNHHQTLPSAMSYPIPQSHAFLTDQNRRGFTTKPQSFGFVQTESPSPPKNPTPSCFPTYSDQRISSKHPSRPAQLTIFYAGTVSVYDSVSPEKAQAIMLLAGNGASSNPQSLVSSSQAQAAFTKPSSEDVCTRNPSRPTAASAGLLSPISTFDRLASQQGGVSDTAAMPSSQQRPEPPKAVNSQRSSVGYVIPGPVPQARKASLARFLEKRRERVTSTQPYSVEQKSTEREHNASSASDNLSCTLGLLI